jgi:hypothetical protein
MTDWEWFWASDQGRDRMLRSQVEQLASQSSQASLELNRQLVAPNAARARGGGLGIPRQRSGQ